MKTFPFLLLFLVTGLAAGAQTRISGTVSDEKGRPVANVNILLKNSYDGSSSDSTGRFSFGSAETGRQMLVLSSVGYDKDSLAVDLNGKPLDLRLNLRTAANELNTVSISAGSFVTGDQKKGAILTSIEIATTAGTAADLYAAMQTLPGAQANFFESGLLVRGGSAAETKTYFDGLLVRSPFNATIPNQASRGRLSAFLFKGTSFFAGGYSAQYGQALSSALVLESTDLPEKTSTGVSFLSVGGQVDRNVRYTNSAITVSGYYYNLAPAYRLIRQAQDFVKAPEQIGGTFQYKAKTSATGMFKVYAAYSKSDLSLNTDNLNAPSSPGFLSNHNRDVYVNATYKEFLGSRWKIEAGAALNRDTDRGRMSADAYVRTDHLLEGRAVVTHFYGQRSSLKFGGETFRTGRDESLNGRSRGYTDQLSAGFVETDLFITRKLVARVGLRTEYATYLAALNVAPRTSLSVKTGEFSQVSAAYGRFFQNPEDMHLVIKPLDFEQADHYIVRYEVNSPLRNFRVEGYHKQYDRLTRLVAGVPETSGSGYARGLDVFWRDKKSIRNADYRISYSYLDTKRTMLDFPTMATPTFAASHTLNAVYSQFLESINTQVGAAYTFASGRPYVNPNTAAYLSDRTKSYNNLSLTMSHLTRIMKQFTVLYVNVTNIAGFRNIYGYRYSDDGRTRRAITPSARRDVFVGLLMTIGDNTFVR